MARSLNKVTLIGNLTRDPDLRYTPAGTAVCTIGLATNRQWVTESGEKKEDAEFHRLVAWNKLAEICSQLLKKGRKIYAEGRLQTRNWTAQDGGARTTTEIVISDMIILDPRRDQAAGEDAGIPEAGFNQDSAVQEAPPLDVSPEPHFKKASAIAEAKADKSRGKEKAKTETPDDEEIPF